MFAELFAKINSFGAHHQAIIAIIIAVCLISISWAIERIFDEFIFPHKPWYGYMLTIIIAVLLLWITKHFILHVI
jgi:uncharacterized membrane protein YwzB